MPYLVQRVTHLYDDPDTTNDDDIQNWLNAKEEEGYLLVGILPNHQVWDDEGNADGKVDAMLIVHKPA